MENNENEQQKPSRMTLTDRARTSREATPISENRTTTPSKEQGTSTTPRSAKTRSTEKARQVLERLKRKKRLLAAIDDLKFTDDHHWFVGLWKSVVDCFNTYERNTGDLAKKFLKRCEQLCLENKKEATFLWKIIASKSSIEHVEKIAREAIIEFNHSHKLDENFGLPGFNYEAYLALSSNESSHSDILKQILQDAVERFWNLDLSQTLCILIQAIFLAANRIKSSIIAVFDSLLKEKQKSSQEQLVAKIDMEAYDVKPNEGRCRVLIINNYEFEDPSRNREGAYDDQLRLNDAFENVLNYRITYKKDLEAKEISDAVKQFAFSSEPCDAAGVIIMSHGEDHVVYGTDDHKVFITDIIKSLHDDRATSLKGVPKFVVIQACRGEKRNVVKTEMNPVRETTTSPASRFVEEISQENFFPPPFGSDTVIAYPCFNNHESYRNEYGSYFIQEFCTVLMRFGQVMDLLDIFTMVSRRVAATTVEEPANKDNSSQSTSKKPVAICLQQPMVITTLRKRFYLTGKPQSHGSA